MIKAFIFKYSTSPDDPYLYDEGVIADPDFFTIKNSNAIIPIWSICGVYYREKLNAGDMVFFVPAKARFAKSHLTSYVCMGV